MTSVRIPPTLRPETGGEREVEASGGTVRDLLDDLMSRFPGLRSQLVEDDEIAPFVNVYVEGEDVRTLDGIDTAVRDGANVILLPAMAGGASSEEPPGSPEPPPLVRLADRRLTPPAGGC
jgi:molybdopterin converting factor small subunit